MTRAGREMSTPRGCPAVWFFFRGDARNLNRPFEQNCRNSALGLEAFVGGGAGEGRTRSAVWDSVGGEKVCTLGGWSDKSRLGEFLELLHGLDWF